MNLNRPLIIDRGKAASYPLKPGVFYKCAVTFVDSSGGKKRRSMRGGGGGLMQLVEQQQYGSAGN